MNENKFPNGTSSYLETYYKVVEAITLTPEDAWNRVTNTLAMKGTGGLFELAEDLTDKFEDKYKDVKWGEELDWSDTLEEFLEEEFKNE